MVKKVPETVNLTALLDEHYSIIFVTLRDFHFTTQDEVRSTLPSIIIETAPQESCSQLAEWFIVSVCLVRAKICYVLRVKQNASCTSQRFVSYKPNRVYLCDGVSSTPETLHAAISKIARATLVTACSS